MLNGSYNLYYMPTNKLTGKTYFDVLFDLVYPANNGSVFASENGYSEYEQSKIQNLRKTVTYYQTKINNTL